MAELVDAHDSHSCTTVCGFDSRLRYLKTLVTSDYKGFVFFDISNNYSGILKKTKAGEYLSTKNNGQGLGLNSVANLVNYHNGVLETNSTGKLFRVSVMLQEQTDHKDNEKEGRG